MPLDRKDPEENRLNNIPETHLSDSQLSIIRDEIDKTFKQETKTQEPKLSTNDLDDFREYFETYHPDLLVNGKFEPRKFRERYPDLLVNGKIDSKKFYEVFYELDPSILANGSVTELLERTPSAFANRLVTKLYPDLTEHDKSLVTEALVEHIHDAFYEYSKTQRSTLKDALIKSIAACVAIPVAAILSINNKDNTGKTPLSRALETLKEAWSFRNSKKRKDALNTKIKNALNR